MNRSTNVNAESHDGQIGPSVDAELPPRTNGEHGDARTAVPDPREDATANPAGQSNPIGSTGPLGAQADRKLAENHVAYLRARGVTEDTARRAGLYSATASELKALFNMPSTPACDGLVIPYSLGGAPAAYERARLDKETDDGQRFLVPAKLKVPIYIGTAKVLDASAPLFITEGPFKTLALAQLGYASIGLGGVNTTLEKSKSGAPVLGESWNTVPVDGRVIYIVFDAGAANNPLVAQAENNLGRALVAAGADVKVIRIPLRGHASKSNIVEVAR